MILQTQQYGGLFKGEGEKQGGWSFYLALFGKISQDMGAP